MRQKVLITRRIFVVALTVVKRHFEVEENPSDVPFSPMVLIKKLQGKMGVIIRLTDQINDKVLSQCPGLKIVSNI
ncbi:MAG: D-glycerate dehydrogenase, partial [Thermodesulfobacteriota bacterium]